MGTAYSAAANHNWMRSAVMSDVPAETPVLDLLATMTAASVEASGLDPQTLMLVRIAALVAVDAPPSSYLLNLGAAGRNRGRWRAGPRRPGSRRTDCGNGPRRLRGRQCRSRAWPRRTRSRAATRRRHVAHRVPTVHGPRITVHGFTLPCGRPGPDQAAAPLLAGRGRARCPEMRVVSVRRSTCRQCH